MKDDTTEGLRAALETAIGDASSAGRGLTAEVERLARAYARACRLAGAAVERVIIDVKEMVRRQAGSHELVYIPRVVGWTVAGYFAGTSHGDAPAPE